MLIFRSNLNNNPYSFFYRLLIYSNTRVWVLEFNLKSLKFGYWLLTT